MERAGAWLRTFRGCSSGATAIEYAMIGAGISILIVVGLTAVGGSVADMFASIVAAF